jgi:hypothetical protein
MKTFRKLNATAVGGVALFMLTQTAPANLIVNGDFETTTAGIGQLGYNTQATGWSTSGYNFLFGTGTADTLGATGQYGNVQLWGPHNGSANGMPASSPAGGNYVAADGAYQVGAISQTVNGLTAGQTYALSFYWAAAQQYTFTGPNTEQWQVSLGAQTQNTAVYYNSSHGFSGWMSQTFDFTASGSSEVLSFLAIGTPTGVPPFSLLDGVTMNAVPESPTLLVSAFILLPVCGNVLRRLWRRQESAQA